MSDTLDIWLTAHAGLSLLPFLLVCSIVFGAAFFRGLTGFGYAILAVPLVSLVAAPTTAVIMAILMQLIIGPFGIRSAVKIINAPMVAKIAALSCLLTPAGLWLLDIVSADLARLVITIIAIGSFVAFMLKRPPELNTSPLHIAFVGSLSGLLNGFAAMPGPPVILHFVRKGVQPIVARGSMITIFFAAATMATAVAWWRGMIDEQTLVLSLLACPLMIGGNQLGAKFFGSVSEPVWRGVVVLLLGIAATMALLRAF
ncbi:sulfite exporter TauE/SafE family protein [Parasphingorhabdus cellanae]|uniref:Probable membrane transporter protein n=1 Tax=Parasphingorhabdus cellanae TaxID=2806553 RepID=A0ABX7T7M3_9SPHN|nr:sulfite exporter TauE/SafE family protein [Parasphingorhabdus cellanae]QTD57610.1 sulfite exporter TauE/SafE family protein [Parasphingorhabdus cellanae]